MNRKCKEIVYVQEGSGLVVVNNQQYPLNTGDTILIEADEPFYWDGHFTLHIVCNPAFTVDQHQLVDGEIIK